MSLVKRNAEVGAEIASSIRDLSLCSSEKNTFQSAQVLEQSESRPKTRVVCIGGAVIDTIAKSNNDCEMIIGTSNPGTIHCSNGGVGRNVAEVLGRLGENPLFYTAIGEDDAGRGLINHLEKECGVITSSKSVHVAAGMNTAQYLALLDHKSDLLGGVADMDALTKIPIPSVDELQGIEYLVMDSNAPAEAITRAAKNGSEAGSLVCFEPTSVPKAKVLASNNEFLECLSYVFPNEDELLAMAESSNDRLGYEISGSTDDDTHIRDAASRLLSRMKSDQAHIVVTLGSRGVLLASKESSSFKHFPADKVSEIKSSNGAGDTLAGSFIHALLQGADEEEAVWFGMKAALLSLDCAQHAISPEISSMARRSDIPVQ